jgi:hypothetical protein
MKPTPGLAFFTLAGTLAYLGLAILGKGGFAAFFSVQRAHSTGPSRMVVPIHRHTRPSTARDQETRRISLA